MHFQRILILFLKKNGTRGQTGKDLDIQHLHSSYENINIKGPKKSIHDNKFFLEGKNNFSNNREFNIFCDPGQVI